MKKEMSPVILHHTESFKFEKVGEGEDAKVIISGNAQPLNEDSRNGVRYRPESVKAAAESLQNVAFLFNHDANRSLGHVSNSNLTKTHLTYEADVDPEEKEYIRKVERGDINHVSVGCMVKNIEWNEDENIYICDVQEYVELSAVPVPGFANTSADKQGAIFLANAIGDTEHLEKLKAAAKENKETDPKDKDTPEDETETSEAKDDDEDDDSGKDEGDDSDDDDKDKDKDETGDDEDDSEEADDEDDDKDKDEKKGEDLDEANPDEGDEAGDEGDATKEDAEGDDAEKDKVGEESLNEDAGAGTEEADEVTQEEKISNLESQVSELNSQYDEVVNRLAILESKVDTLAEEEDDDDPESDNDEATEPDKTESFKSKDSEELNKIRAEALEKKKKDEDKKGKEEIDLRKLGIDQKAY